MNSFGSILTAETMETAEDIYMDTLSLLYSLAHFGSETVPGPIVAVQLLTTSA